MLKLLEWESIFYDVKKFSTALFDFHLFFSFTMLEVLGCKCDLLHEVGVGKVLIRGSLKGKP
jgi:hypothetical protein